MWGVWQAASQQVAGLIFGMVTGRHAQVADLDVENDITTSINDASAVVTMTQT